MMNTTRYNTWSSAYERKRPSFTTFRGPPEPPLPPPLPGSSSAVSTSGGGDKEASGGALYTWSSVHERKRPSFTTFRGPPEPPLSPPLPVSPSAVSTSGGGDKEASSGALYVSMGGRTDLSNAATAPSQADRSGELETYEKMSPQFTFFDELEKQLRRLGQEEE